MKKVICIAVVLMFVAGLAFGQGDTHAKYIYEYRITNDNTMIAKTTAIPITSIRPNVDKLIGYRVLPSAGVKDHEVYCGIYDGTDFTLSGESFGESEAVSDSTAGELWIIPKKITNGVVVQQGMNSTVIVYFIRE